ncbi:MAG TPA: GlsB/YeaQ/YmgE family stress response membrane protein [Candidatus Dormibacteraeota bacterium]|nr:GlsB/YeaQ/YmgE family stress response membrane protein [Candidatus Dormibacteraeota bacterium]
MTLDHLLLIILVGLVAGFLATHLVAGHGYGLAGDIIVGILGALVGFLVLGGFIATYILTPLGIASASVLGQIIIAFIGAAILLAILRLVTGMGWRSGPRRAYGRRRWL